jgi:hypothetical protein
MSYLTRFKKSELKFGKKVTNNAYCDFENKLQGLNIFEQLENISKVGDCLMKTFANLLMKPFAYHSSSCLFYSIQ